MKILKKLTHCCNYIWSYQQCCDKAVMKDGNYECRWRIHPHLKYNSSTLIKMMRTSYLSDMLESDECFGARKWISIIRLKHNISLQITPFVSTHYSQIKLLTCVCGNVGLLEGKRDIRAVIEVFRSMKSLLFVVAGFCSHKIPFHDWITTYDEKYTLHNKRDRSSQKLDKNKLHLHVPKHHPSTCWKSSCRSDGH